MCNEGVSLMDLFIENAEIELGIFDVDNMIDYLQFKWVTFARPSQFFGFIMHLFYMSVLTLYINGIYVKNNDENKALYNSILYFGIFYPAFYDFNQMYRQGLR